MMIRNGKKAISLIIAMVLVGTSLVGCGGSKAADSAAGSAKDKNVTLKVWVDSASPEYTKKMIEDFKKQNPDKTYNIEIKVSDSGKAQEEIKKDPSAAADVFMLPHDQLGQLVESGNVYENTKYVDRIKGEDTSVAVDAASYKGKVYGYPYGVESMFLYYNKSKLSKEDVKTFEGLTQKGKIGLNLAEKGSDYELSPFFVANGCKLYGDKGEDSKGTTFNSPQGVKVLNWFAALKNNKSVVACNADSLVMLKSGKIDAVFGGPWSKNDMIKTLGDNMGVAPYPTVDFGNGPVQAMAYQGVKLFAVNANTKYPLDAMALAYLLSNKGNQEERYKDLGTVPCNKELQASDEVSKDAVSNAVATMTQKDHSILMPKISEINTFWDPINALINDSYAGKINASQMQSKLDDLVANTSGKK